MYTRTTNQSRVRMGSGEGAAEQPEQHEDRRFEDHDAHVRLGHGRIVYSSNIAECVHGAKYIEFKGSRFTVHGSGFLVLGSWFLVLHDVCWSVGHGRETFR